jgi:cyanophycin synthetase
VLGASVRELGDGFYEVTDGRASTRVWNHWAPLDDIVTAQLALEKHLVHQLLLEADVPVPEHRVFRRDELAEAVDWVHAGEGAFVVKPAASSGGGAVTSGVETRDEALRAFVRAARLGSRILVERVVPGDMYRLLLLDGELLGAVLRHPPSVVGDGRSSIADLIAAENLRRNETVRVGPRELLRIDLDCVLALARQGRTLGSIPALDAAVQVKGIVSQNAPEENETVSAGGLAPKLVEEARRAAAAVGVRLAGVDVITTDPESSLRATGGAVLEVNATPGLRYHYQVRDPERATRVAVPILRTLLAAADGRRAAPGGG